MVVMGFLTCTAIGAQVKMLPKLSVRFSHDTARERKSLRDPCSRLTSKSHPGLVYV